MSHSVVITLNTIKTNISTCDHAILDLKEIEKFEWDHSTKISITSKIDQIEDLKRSFLSTVGSSDLINLQHKASTLTKEISNLKFFMNSEYEKFIEDNSGIVQSFVEEFGVLAIEAVQNLEKTKIEVNKNNLSKEIEKIRNENISEENLKKYRSHFIKEIEISSFDSKIQLQFINMINNYKTVQEVSDIAPFISAKQDELRSLKIYFKDFSEALKNTGFKPIEKTAITFDDEGIFKLKMKFKNEQNNTVQINFDSEGKIKYKLGNYVGHACEKTTDKILKELDNKGYTYATPKIRRDIDNAKPLSKAAKVMGK